MLFCISSIVVRGLSHPPDPAAESVRKAVVALRMACKMTRTAFASMIEMKLQSLWQKENGRVRFQPEEVAAIKGAVGLHLASCVRALETLNPHS